MLNTTCEHCTQAALHDVRRTMKAMAARTHLRHRAYSSPPLMHDDLKQWTMLLHM
jgi:hypothetical protein